MISTFAGEDTSGPSSNQGRTTQALESLSRRRPREGVLLEPARGRFLQRGAPMTCRLS